MSSLEQHAKAAVEKYFENHVVTAIARAPKKVHIGEFTLDDGDTYDVYLTAEVQGNGRTRKSC
jgi:hypothetical protein